MKRISILKLICFCLLWIAIGSCKKSPGEGGTSMIKGKIFINKYNPFGQLITSYYAQEERVYVIYGDADFYGMDTKTGYDGTYEFSYLHKGKYTIYAYSNCDTCPSGNAVVKMETEITKNNSVVELPDLVLTKY